MNPKVAIILPVHNSLPHLAVAIKHLFESTTFPFKLIIVESESNDGTAQYVDTLKRDYENVEVYHTEKKGLPAAINFGIEKAGDLDVYITQDDVIHFKLYERDWLEEMHNQSKKENMGLVTSLAGHGVSGKLYVDGMRWAGTWSLYLSRKTIKKVGLFDEKMGPGDDIDYSYRIGQAGLKCCICDFWVQHHRLTEHGEVDSREKQLKMSRYFKKKWNIE